MTGEAKPSELSYSNPIGLPELRKNLASYLKIHRNIDCSPEQILITSDTVHSLYLATALVNTQDEVVLENPTFTMVSQLFKSIEARNIPASIDKEGLHIPKDSSSNPKIIYTTPSNQYPTVVKISMARRAEILKWASQKGAVIIEDDNDQEFTNWNNPMTSLFSLDKQHRVIYLGSFNKRTHPSLRLGYMIVPPYLLDAFTVLQPLPVDLYRYIK
ncbi:aminotransferase class I/II-fold pyridoxal phosphate-dependent enzyme [Salegentibacter sp. F14]